MPTRS